MRMSGRGSGSLTRMVILFGATFDSDRRNRPRNMEAESEIPFPSATKGELNSLQFEKFAIMPCAFISFLLTRHNEKRAGVHSNSAFCGMLGGKSHCRLKIAFCRS